MKKVDDILGRIYLITNLINGKLYVGQTIRTINERWAGHKCDANKYNKGTAMCRAIRKYGSDNFKIELLEDNIPYDMLDDIEIKYIEKYNSTTPFGYNVSYGGQGFRTEKDRELMSKRVKGENNPMYGMHGELNPFYGHKHSDEAISVLSQKGKERWDNLSEEEKQKQIERLDKMRLSMLEKCGGGFKGFNHTEESKTAISEKLKGKVFSEEHNRKISENSTRKQRIVMLDLQGNLVKEFDSMTKGSEYIKDMNICNTAKSGTISKVCLSRGEATVYGYFWLYYCDYVSKNYELKVKFKNKPRKVICLTNNKIYENSNKGRIDTGCTANGILGCCSKKYKYCSNKEKNRFVWMFLDEYEKLNESEKACLLYENSKGE